MIYSYDKAAQIPLMDLYDTQMILASVNAAKDMYEKGVKQLEDFHNKYDDFMSPITKDMEWHEKNVIQKMQNTINDLYARGIDPLRSAEGRTAIAQLKNSIDTGRIARNKISAANAQLFLLNKAKLEAAGAYDLELLDFVSGGMSLDNWDSANGIWQNTSPILAKSLKDVTEYLYNNRTPHDLTEEDLAKNYLTPYEYDKNYKYKGYTYKDLLNTAKDGVPGLTGNVYSDFYRYKAEQQLKQEGNINPTKEEVEARFERNVADANREWMIEPVSELDQLAKLRIAAEFNRQQQERSFRFLKELQQMKNDGGNGRSNRTSGNGSNPVDKQQIDYLDYMTASTAANILSQTQVGRNAGIGSYSDYTATAAAGLMYDAQKEIASDVYNYSTGSYQTNPDGSLHITPLQQLLLGQKPDRSLFPAVNKWMDRHVNTNVYRSAPMDRNWYEKQAEELAKKNIEDYKRNIPIYEGHYHNEGPVNYSEPGLLRGGLNNFVADYNYSEADGRFKIPTLEEEKKRLLKANPDYVNYDKILHEQNLKMLGQMSIEFDPSQFAEWVKRLRDSDNQDYSLMNLKVDKSRIYSADEVALTSAGVDRPTDAKTSMRKTKLLRKLFEQKFKDGYTEMIGAGHIVGRVGEDGANHIFAIINIVNKHETKGSDTEPSSHGYSNMFSDDEYIYYDMGVDTQGSPDFKFTKEANMDIKGTPRNFGSDREMLKDLGVGSTNVKSDNSIPYIQDTLNVNFLDENLLDLFEQ